MSHDQMLCKKPSENCQTMNHAACTVCTRPAAKKGGVSLKLTQYHSVVVVTSSLVYRPTKSNSKTTTVEIINHFVFLIFNFCTNLKHKQSN